jgi:hypothetical protein
MDLNNARVLQQHMFTAARTIAEAEKKGWDYGACHIFVADGNCTDDDLQFCLADDRVTAEEREFLTYMLEEVDENVRFGAWALAQCSDILTDPSFSVPLQELRVIARAAWSGDPTVLTPGTIVDIIAMDAPSPGDVAARAGCWVRTKRDGSDYYRYRSCSLSDLTELDNEEDDDNVG